MARIKYYNSATGQWEYADSQYSTGSGGNVDLTGVVKSVNGAMPDENGNVEITASGVYTLAEGETIEDVPPEYDVVIDPYAESNAGNTGSIQSDWNQNDPDAPDYIKNRPFYDSSKWKCVQEPQMVEVRKDNGVSTGEIGICLNDNHFLQREYPVGTVFKLIVGGDEYVGTYKKSLDGYSGCVGNGSWLTYGGYPDTDEDFLIVYYGADSIGIATKKPLTAGEVSVYMLEGEEVHKIDSKYLPDEWLEQADWNQNDPDAPDYIKNRPFYSKVIESEVTLTINPGDVVGASVADQIYEQRTTAKYACSSLNTGYTFSYWYDEAGTKNFYLYDGTKSIKVIRSSEDTLLFYPQPAGDPVTVDVTFYGEKTMVKKLDPKYLPIDIVNLYVCSDGEYTADSSPTITEPDENTTYLVPQDNEGTLYASWVYDDAWKLVEMLTITFEETEIDKAELIKDVIKALPLYNGEVITV